MHQQPPSRPPLPQSNATPQRAQARRRGGNPCSVAAVGIFFFLNYVKEAGEQYQ